MSEWILFVQLINVYHLHLGKNSFTIWAHLKTKLKRAPVVGPIFFLLSSLRWALPVGIGPNRFLPLWPAKWQPRGVVFPSQEGHPVSGLRLEGAEGLLGQPGLREHQVVFPRPEDQGNSNQRLVQHKNRADWLYFHAVWSSVNWTNCSLQPMKHFLRQHGPSWRC